MLGLANSDASLTGPRVSLCEGRFLLLATAWPLFGVRSGNEVSWKLIGIACRYGISRAAKNFGRVSGKLPALQCAATIF
jgi:hypothetical protein